MAHSRHRVEFRRARALLLRSLVGMLILMTVALPASRVGAQSTQSVGTTLTGSLHVDSQGFVVYDFVKPLENGTTVVVQGKHDAQVPACHYTFSGPRLRPGSPPETVQAVAENSQTCQLRVQEGSGPSPMLDGGGGGTSCPYSTTGGINYNYYCAYAYAKFVDCCGVNVASTKAQIQWWGGTGTISGIGYNQNIYWDSYTGWNNQSNSWGHNTNYTNWAQTHVAAVDYNIPFCTALGLAGQEVYVHFDSVDINVWQDGSINANFNLWKYSTSTFPKDCSNALAPQSWYGYGW